MHIRLSLIIAGAIVILVLAPVLFTQSTPGEARTLQGLRLEDITFQEVIFTNDVQDVELAGLLFLPAGDGPFPAVVVIHGSGTSHRDNPWYLTFVSYLQSQGIAVLLPDKRGSESSAGDWRTASFEDLATDALSAISYLQTQYPDAISDIGILGASQGGQIAPIVASQSSEVAFVVNVVGAAVPLHRVLVYEENHNLQEMGFPPGLSHVVARLSSLYIRKIAQREFWDSIGNFDPLPYWEDVDVPTLVLYGELDTNVPSEASAERLATLEKSNVRVVTFEGSGHSLEDPEGMGDTIFRQDALDLIRAFIAEAAAGR